MNLLFIDLSPASCYFLLLRSTHYPQHPVLEDTQSVFLPSCVKSSFTLPESSKNNMDLIF